MADLSVFCLFACFLRLLPHQLAGVLSALLAEGARRDQVITFEPSSDTLLAIDQLYPMHSRLVQAQQRQKLEVAVTIDVRTKHLLRKRKGRNALCA